MATNFFKRIELKVVLWNSLHLPNRILRELYRAFTRQLNYLNLQRWLNWVVKKSKNHNFS